MRVACLFVIALFCQIAAAQTPIDIDWEAPLSADLEEGRAILSILRDRMRILYIQKGNTLPETVSLSDLKNDMETLRGKFYPGVFSSVVAGNAENRYKGTYINIGPLEGVDAPSLTLEFESVAKGTAKLTADRQSPIVLEGEALLGALKDRMRVINVQRGGLAADLSFKDLGESLEKLKGKYFPGDVEVAVRGSKDDGFKGTSIAIYPLADVRAAKMTYTFTSVSQGNGGAAVDCRWYPAHSDGRRVLLKVGAALTDLYKKENRIPAKADLKTLDLTLDGLKGEHYASEVVIKVKGDAKDAYKGTIVTARELGKGGGYMSLVFANGVSARGEVVFGLGESPALAEGRDLLSALKDRMRVKFVFDNNKLPADLEVSDLMSKAELVGKYYAGEVELKLAGTADNGYKDTTIAIKPLKGVDAPVLVLTIQSIPKNEFEIKAQE